MASSIEIITYLLLVVIGPGVRVRTSLLTLPSGCVVDGELQHSSSPWPRLPLPEAAMWPASGEAYELTPMHCFTAGPN